MQRSTGTSSVCFTPSRLGSNEYFVEKPGQKEGDSWTKTGTEGLIEGSDKRLKRTSEIIRMQMRGRLACV